MKAGTAGSSSNVTPPEDFTLLEHTQLVNSAVDAERTRIVGLFDAAYIEWLAERDEIGERAVSWPQRYQRIIEGLRAPRGEK